MDILNVRRIADRNTLASEVGEKVPPAHTVEHAISVEARLIRATAARKKLERAAEGAGAADLAQAVLARVGVRDAEAVQAQELCEPPASIASNLDFMDVDETPPPLIDVDSDMDALFSTAEPRPEYEQESVFAPQVQAKSAKSGEGNEPANRSRLKNLLKEIDEQ